MKFRLILLLAINLFQLNVYSQGQWRWVSGSNSSYYPVYGPVNVASSTIDPGSRYTSLHWNDNQGIFWMFGGLKGLDGSNDLWSYNPNTNEWTFYGGDIDATPAVYNTQGVESSGTWPGGSAHGPPAWVSENNLWMYGGGGSEKTDDLWRYNTNTGKWTWMKGSSFDVPAIYGTKGIANVNNTPGGNIDEITCSWIGKSGNLWFFNWLDGVMWEYDIALNQWIWQTGVPYASSSYSPMGTYSSIAYPGIEDFPFIGIFSSWTDSENVFWMIYQYLPNSEIWKFNPEINQWSFVKQFKYNDLPILCEEDVDNEINIFEENRSVWVDNCDNVWKLTGDDNAQAFMWRFNPNENAFTLINSYSTTEIFGEKGSFSPFSHPVSSKGAVYWQNKTGFWYKHGYSANSTMWQYVPDSIQADFIFEHTDCSKVIFDNLSNSGCNNIKSYNWDFGEPISISNQSTDQNPSHTYQKDGEYEVTLIVENCTWDKDTLIKTILIECDTRENSPIDCSIKMPTAFTPNVDNLNDSYYPIITDNIEMVSFKIYNRWGTIVHSGLKAWKGKYKNKKQSSDNYVYFLKYKCSNETISKTGSFALIQ